MSDPPAVVSYIVHEPFEAAVATVRLALSHRRLRVVEMLNVSERIQSRLSIRVAPCVVFLVTPQESAPAGFPLSAAASAFLPLHVVVAARAREAQVHVLRTAPVETEPLGVDGATAFARFREAVAEAIESVAMRVAAPV